VNKATVSLTSRSTGSVIVAIVRRLRSYDSNTTLAPAA
jgi:hypothetical protein